MHRSLLALPFAAALAACSPRPTPAVPERPAAAAAAPAPGLVDGATAQALVEAGARLVDVRTPQEFVAGHVPGSLNIPFDQIGARAGELGDRTQPVVLYCRTGRRSGVAAATLRELGFTRVYDMQRFTDWPAAAGR